MSHVIAQRGFNEDDRKSSPSFHLDMDRFMEVLQFAAHKHRHQKRKDPDRTPYINHPIGKFARPVARFPSSRLLLSRCCAHSQSRSERSGRRYSFRNSSSFSPLFRFDRFSLCLGGAASRHGRRYGHDVRRIGKTLRQTYRW